MRVLPLGDHRLVAGAIGLWTATPGGTAAERLVTGAGLRAGVRKFRIRCPVHGNVHSDLRFEGSISRFAD